MAKAGGRKGCRKEKITEWTKPEILSGEEKRRQMERNDEFKAKEKRKD